MTRSKRRSTPLTSRSTIKRTAALVAIPVLAGTMSLSACGGNDSSSGSTSAAGSATATTSSTAGATGTATDAAASCPTDGNTRAFAKTRFVADIGLAAGTFHRWIYKPYQAGTFKKGAEGRNTAIVKAVATAALDAKLINNAYKNVEANPTLCKSLKGPLGKLKDSINSMQDGLKSGDLTSIATTQALVSSVMGTAQQNGLKITETTDTNAATN